MPASENTPITSCSQFTIPNTAYVDRPYLGGVGYWVMTAYASAIARHQRDIWQQEGLYVVYTSGDAVNEGSIKAHLTDDHLYKYFYLGHGLLGSMASANSGPFWFVPWGQYTQYGIARMWLLGCGMFDQHQTWQKNVAKGGSLIISTDDHLSTLNLLLLDIEDLPGTAQ
jgi:hypothetical protein